MIINLGRHRLRRCDSNNWVLEEPCHPRECAFMKSDSQIADEVIEGRWGNGYDRRNRLIQAGYDYYAIQALVNEKLGASARKTCRLDLTDVETYGNIKVITYECSECGRSCEEVYGKYERCPHCGRVVVDD